MSFTIADLKLALVIAAGILLAPIMAAVIAALAFVSLYAFGLTS